MEHHLKNSQAKVKLSGQTGYVVILGLDWTVEIPPTLGLPNSSLSYRVCCVYIVPSFTFLQCVSRMTQKSAGMSKQLLDCTLTRDTVTRY